MLTTSENNTFSEEINIKYQKRKGSSKDKSNGNFKTEKYKTKII